MLSFLNQTPKTHNDCINLLSFVNLRNHDIAAIHACQYPDTLYACLKLSAIHVSLLHHYLKLIQIYGANSVSKAHELLSNIKKFDDLSEANKAIFFQLLKVQPDTSLKVVLSHLEVTLALGFSSHDYNTVLARNDVSEFLLALNLLYREATFETDEHLNKLLDLPTNSKAHRPLYYAYEKLCIENFAPIMTDEELAARHLLIENNIYSKETELALDNCQVRAHISADTPHYLTPLSVAERFVEALKAKVFSKYLVKNYRDLPGFIDLTEIIDKLKNKAKLYQHPDHLVIALSTRAKYFDRTFKDIIQLEKRGLATIPHTLKYNLMHAHSRHALVLMFDQNLMHLHEVVIRHQWASEIVTHLTRIPLALRTESIFQFLLQHKDEMGKKTISNLVNAMLVMHAKHHTVSTITSRLKEISTIGADIAKCYIDTLDAMPAHQQTQENKKFICILAKASATEVSTLATKFNNYERKLIGQFLKIKSWAEIFKKQSLLNETNLRSILDVGVLLKNEELVKKLCLIDSTTITQGSFSVLVTHLNSILNEPSTHLDSSKCIELLGERIVNKGKRPFETNVRNECLEIDPSPSKKPFGGLSPRSRSLLFSPRNLFSNSSAPSFETLAPATSSVSATVALSSLGTTYTTTDAGANLFDIAEATEALLPAPMRM